MYDLNFVPYLEATIHDGEAMQVVVAGGGRHAALATGAKGTTMSYYVNASKMNEYWHSGNFSNFSQRLRMFFSNNHILISCGLGVRRLK